MPDATRKTAQSSHHKRFRNGDTDPRAGCVQAPRAPQLLPQDIHGARALAILAGRPWWVNGTHISYYCFKRGDAVPAAWHGSGSDADAVDAAFETWARLGLGISFGRVEAAEDAMVRVGFDTRDGSWCPIGRELLELRDPLQRTMNFGRSLATAAGRQVALHEIGHLLGLDHEPPDADSVMRSAGAPATEDPPSTNGVAHDVRGGLSFSDKARVVESYPGVRAPAALALKVGQSQLLRLKPGETRVFDFHPPRTRVYTCASFGRSDAVLVLFECKPEGNVTMAGHDDGGTAGNARVDMHLDKSRHYQLGVRLYFADAPSEISVMVW